MARSLGVLSPVLWVGIILLGSGCGSGSPQFNLSGVSVVITASATTVQAGGTLTFTATVTGDPNNEGVNWSLSCPTAPCGVLSPSSTQSGATMTYTAPSTPPAGDLGVVITATSVANPSVSKNSFITITGITISVTSSATTVPIGTTAQITATVSGDPAGHGVTWTVTCSAAPCGTVSPTASQSGAAITYTAPNSYPAGDLAVNIIATSVSNPGATNFVSVTVPGTAVSVTQSSSSIDTGATVQLTANVVNDSTNQGVSWSVSCSTPPCGTIFPAATLSGVPTTYTASNTPPPNNVYVTITATTVFNSVSTTASITVLAVTISATPVSALLPLNTSAQFTATVNNDPANLGVTWALTQNGTLCSPGCGTIAPSSTLSGVPTSYTAPATLPATPGVLLTANSVEDPTKSYVVSITLSPGTVELIPDSIDFGSVRVNSTSSPQFINLTNTGNSLLNISAITIGGTDPLEFAQTNTCGNSVVATSSCQITVTFKPKARGTQTATLSIVDSSSDSPQNVSLAGIGVTQRAGFNNSTLQAVLSTSASAISPSPSGPFKVGTRILSLTEPSRKDPYTGGRGRQLLVRFWYPSSLTEHVCKRAEYTSSKVWDYFSQLLGLRLPAVQSNSCLDASIAAGTHPVLLFTPGYTATFTDYTFLFEDLASRGYMVASVDHTYEATAVEFPDGRLLTTLVGSHLDDSWKGDDRTITLAVSVRLRDLRFLVNELSRLNVEADSPLKGKLDLDRLAIAGHSLGGATAMLALELDSRFRAAVVIDGHIDQRVLHGTDRPVLMLGMGAHPSPDQCSLWDGLHGPRFAVSFIGAEHVTPSDAIWLAKGVIRTGAVSTDETIAQIRDSISAFLDATLLGKPRSVFRELSLKHPDLPITTGGRSLCKATAKTNTLAPPRE